MKFYQRAGLLIVIYSIFFLLVLLVSITADGNSGEWNIGPTVRIIGIFLLIGSWLFIGE